MTKRTTLFSFLDDEAAHRVDDDGSGAAVDATAEWEEEALGARTAQVIPEPARWA